MQDSNNFNIHLPDLETIKQGKEFLFLERDGRKEKIEFHDYDRIYEIPGLYEHLFYEQYKCNSPVVVCGLLKKHIEQEHKDNEQLVALDIGAGNGMMGEQLADLGAKAIVGVDIIDEAAEAVQRDRPGIYDAYHVADLTDMPPDVEQSLKKIDFNCMTVVAALGFGDIPPDAFASGYNLVSAQGWVAFNIKEDFICAEDQSGFCKLIERLEDDGIVEIRERLRYRHRFCQDGTPLYYYAVVGKKQMNISTKVLAEISVALKPVEA
ncbi:MAG: methyltransferase domain-containing protein [Desulfobacteraceae bacterium]|nr:methyltransferase domain-containing protein [Desulfobacteraceae bacterium]